MQRHYTGCDRGNFNYIAVLKGPIKVDLLESIIQVLSRYRAMICKGVLGRSGSAIPLHETNFLKRSVWIHTSFNLEARIVYFRGYMP